MTNLTKIARESIATAAVLATYDPKLKALAEAEDALGREAYATLFSKEELAAVAKIPQNWVRHDSCLRFNAGGFNVTLTLAHNGLPVPYFINGHRGYSCHVLGSIPAGDLCDRIQAHVLLLQKTKAEKSDTYRKVLAMLESARTLKKLNEIWPEGKSFYEKYEGQKGVALPPAIRVEEINAMLGLSAAA